MGEAKNRNAAAVQEAHLACFSLDDFIEHIREHARGTLAEEQGCVQFDVLVPKEAPKDARRADAA